MAPLWGHSIIRGTTMAAKKKPGRKAPARKVAAVSRLREGLAKKKREPAHVLEDVTPPPVQPEFDFRALGEAQLKQASPTPEPGPAWHCEKVQAYNPHAPQYEGTDPTIPRDIHINIGRCSISLIFR